MTAVVDTLFQQINARLEECRDDIRRGIIERAALATVENVGPLPENAKDLPAQTREWMRLMRRHDPRLDPITDEELWTLVLAVFDGEDDGQKGAP